MARVGHVSVDTTVRTVGPATALLCLVDLDVLNNKALGVERLALGIALSVGEDVQKVFHGLLREPATRIRLGCLLG